MTRKISISFKKKKPQVQRKEQSFTSDLVFLVKSLVKLLLIIQKKNRVTLTPSVAICMIRNGAMHVIDVIPIPLPCQSNAIEITSRIVFPATITYFKCTREICETARRELRIEVFFFFVINISKVAQENGKIVTIENRNNTNRCPLPARDVKGLRWCWTILWKRLWYCSRE